MNKKGGLGGTLLIILLIAIVIELVFCIYVMYSCYSTMGLKCDYPNMFGLGKYMVIPVKGMLPMDMNLSQNMGNFTLR